jgi:hypothetical protein
MRDCDYDLHITQEEMYHSGGSPISQSEYRQLKQNKLAAIKAKEEASKTQTMQTARQREAQRVGYEETRKELAVANAPKPKSWHASRIKEIENDWNLTAAQKQRRINHIKESEKEFLEKEEQQKQKAIIDADPIVISIRKGFESFVKAFNTLWTDEERILVGKMEAFAEAGNADEYSKIHDGLRAELSARHKAYWDEKRKIADAAIISAVEAEARLTEIETGETSNV